MLYSPRIIVIEAKQKTLETNTPKELAKLFAQEIIKELDQWKKSQSLQDTLERP